MSKNVELSVILPCRNEQSALRSCIKQIKSVIKENKLSAEIIVSDSSTDKSPQIAKSERVTLVKHDQVGYGRAYLEAFPHARGKYIFMADPDGSYDFNEIPRFLLALKSGFDFVIGNRFSNKIKKGVMPWHHKYIGNPILSGTLKLFFGRSVNDAHCGMRAISSSALQKLQLNTTGMEFASEMVMKSLKQKLKIKELPISLHERKGESKLRSFRDGWRHLRFMLLHSPLFLFLIPGLISLLIGIEMFAWLYFSSPKIGGIQFFFHPMFLASALIIIGYQLIIFAAFSKTYLTTQLGEENKLLEKLYKHITIEKAGTLGLLITLIGAIIYLSIFVSWINSDFSSLNQVKNSIIALTLLVIGVQTIFSSFMLSILGIKGK
tara:strand:- start:369 stop:1502 length:1134 start_codon:yes stop_codon:yes gene_type:complete